MALETAPSFKRQMLNDYKRKGSIVKRLMRENAESDNIPFIESNLTQCMRLQQEMLDILFSMVS